MDPNQGEQGQLDSNLVCENASFQNMEGSGGSGEPTEAEQQMGAQNFGEQNPEILHDESKKGFFGKMRSKMEAAKEQLVKAAGVAGPQGAALEGVPGMNPPKGVGIKGAVMPANPVECLEQYPSMGKVLCQHPPSIAPKCQHPKETFIVPKEEMQEHEYKGEQGDLDVHQYGKIIHERDPAIAALPDVHTFVSKVTVKAEATEVLADGLDILQSLHQVYLQKDSPWSMRFFSTNMLPIYRVVEGISSFPFSSSPSF